MNVGMQVTDASGGPVGTVKAIQGANLLIKTDKHEALAARDQLHGLRTASCCSE